MADAEQKDSTDTAREQMEPMLAAGRDQTEPMLKADAVAVQPAVIPLLSPIYSMVAFGALLLPLVFGGAGAAFTVQDPLYGVVAVLVTLLVLLLLTVRLLCPFQVFLLQRPTNCVSRILLPAMELLECGFTCSNTYLDLMQRFYGPYYASAGQLVICDWQEIERRLTSPQARPTNLGAQPFMPSHLPGLDIGGRQLMLLALSDEGAGGDSNHSAFKSCIADHMLGEAWELRRNDETTQRLLEQLVTEYRELNVAQKPGGNAFFMDPNKGIVPFLVKNYHYVMFGLDPNDIELQKTLIAFFCGLDKVAHYLNVIGSSMDFTEMIDKVAAIYEKSPALKDFKEGCPAYNSMSRKELSRLMVALMRIAAITGSTHLATTAMGGQLLPYIANKDDVTKTWDTLDLNDREAVQLYLLECSRLYPPVSTASHLLTKPLTVPISGCCWQRTFPVGTKVLIPYTLGNIDPKVWGPTYNKFDAKRTGLRTNLLSFSSVGDRDAGRICPGRALVMETLTDVLQALGKTRR